MAEKIYITIETTINAPMQTVWDAWTKPEHMMKWNFASNDWCCPSATNDLRVSGKFTSRMESKDGKMGFDFGGTYSVVEPNSKIAYTMSDGRTVDTTFTAQGDAVHISETFQAESQNPVKMQQDGWQSILNNFKKYVESLQ